MEDGRGGGLDDDDLQTLTIQHQMTGEEQAITCSLEDFDLVPGTFEYSTLLLYGIIYT